MRVEPTGALDSRGAIEAPAPVDDMNAYANERVAPAVAS